jgi:hypothetical protein
LVVVEEASIIVLGDSTGVVLKVDFGEADVVMPKTGLAEFGGVTLEADLRELPGTFTVGYSSIGFQFDGAIVTADVEVLDVKGTPAPDSAGTEWT